LVVGPPYLALTIEMVDRVLVEVEAHSTVRAKPYEHGARKFAVRGSKFYAMCERCRITEQVFTVLSMSGHTAQSTASVSSGVVSKVGASEVI